MSSRTAPAVLNDPTVDRLRLAITRLSRQLRRQQSDDGLTPTQHSTLASIKREGPVTLGRIAELERIAPPTVTKVVDKLTELGLVTRQTVATDRRVVKVAATPRALRLFSTSRARKAAWLHARLATLSPAEAATLADAVAILEKLVEEEPR